MKELLEKVNCDAPEAVELEFFNSLDGFGLRLSYEMLEEYRDNNMPFSIKMLVGEERHENGIGQVRPVYKVWAYDGKKALKPVETTGIWIFYDPTPERRDICPYCGTDNTGLRQGWDCIQCDSN